MIEKDLTIKKSNYIGLLSNYPGKYGQGRLLGRGTHLEGRPHAGRTAVGAGAGPEDAADGGQELGVLCKEEVGKADAPRIGIEDKDGGIIGIEAHGFGAALGVIASGVGARSGGAALITRCRGCSARRGAFAGGGGALRATTSTLMSVPSKTLRSCAPAFPCGWTRGDVAVLVSLLDRLSLLGVALALPRLSL